MSVVMLSLSAMSSNTILKVLLAALIVLAVLMFAFALVLIVALRKRAPVVKVIMAPPTVAELHQTVAENESAEQAEQDGQAQSSAVSQGDYATQADSDDGQEDEPDVDKDDDDEDVTFVTEGSEKVRYDRSFKAKLAQLKDERKEWYSQLKNTLLSYEKVRSRISWKKESFRIGRVTFARIIVRGRTLCLLLAADPSGFSGTKFSVENVGHTVSLSDTPCMYRIKSVRRMKYAKELISAFMSELGVQRRLDYQASDYYVPYAGDLALMEKGLIKRVVYGGTKTFEIREADNAAATVAQKQEDVD